MAGIGSGASRRPAPEVPKTRQLYTYAMSRRNGDRCKFHIARRRKLALRVRRRALKARLLNPETK